MNSRRAFARALGVEQRSVENGNRPLTIEQLLAETNTPITTDDALGVTATYAAVTLLADTIAGLPIDVFERRGRSRIEVASPRWLAEPNDEDLPRDIIEQSVTSLLLRGNAYLLTERDAAQRIERIWVLDPDRVAPRKKRVGNRTQIVYYVDGRELTAADIVHIPLTRKPGSLVGMSPLRAAAETTAVALEAQRHAAALLRNGAMPGGLIEVEGQLSDQGVNQLKQGWQDAHGGEKKGGVGVITEGAKFRGLSVSPADAELLATRRWSVEDVARAFRVPPHLIGSTEKTSSWGAGIQEMSRGFVVFSLGGHLTRLESHMTRLVREERPLAQVKLNTDALLRGETVTRYRAHEVGLRAGFLTLDEVRRIEDLPPLPNNARPDNGPAVA
ncbi:phage portal protein [Blastococcus tunisiensis]|uniref:Phage portal protein, HK97 family n=1 Tax=Blastococcus tunisiensis TaxID=1798228 RepID=A0A1I2JEE7_9ACTN|nr:phage portal protein [Blastococcus sp. DSM 46838]SFF52934.1 phage portal protein, HK97 family [Blastococcus sp. DSM 46838]